MCQVRLTKGFGFILKEMITVNKSSLGWATVVFKNNPLATTKTTEQFSSGDDWNFQKSADFYLLQKAIADICFAS